MLKLPFIILSIFVFTSCVSEKRLFEKSDLNNRKSLDINHTYCNSSDSVIHYSLAETLIGLKQVKVLEKRIPEYKTLDAQLEYDGDKRLKIILFDGTLIKDEFTLRVKNKGDHLSIKRKCLFIPIPFLFFIYKNRKAILFSDSNGDLNIIQGNSQFIWVFIANGNNSIKKNTFDVKNE